MTFEFALKAILYCEILESMKKFVLARQLLRSSTSIGANVREAQNAESRADFIHKMKVANKELDETEYWLHLCEHSPSYPSPNELLLLHPPIRKVLTKIISTSKTNNLK